MSDDNVRLYRKEADGPEGFVRLNIKKTAFDRPTVLCCCGQGVTHDNLNDAAGFCKKAKALLNTLDVKDDSIPYQILGVTYSRSAITKNDFRSCKPLQDMLAITGHKPEHYIDPKNEYEYFVEQQLTPLFLDKEGHKLSLNEVKKNFRNINVLTYSYGAVFIQKVGEELVDNMLNAGFTQSEIDEATRQILVVTAGPTASLGAGRAKFTQVNILHSQDRGINAYCQNGPNAAKFAKRISPDTDFIARPIAADPKSKMLTLDKDSSEWLLYATSRPKYFSVIVTTDLNHLEKGPQLNFPDNYHGTDIYFDHSRNQAGFMLSLVASTLLNNGLNNSIKNHTNKFDNFTSLPPANILLHSPAYEKTMPKSYKNREAVMKKIDSWRDEEQMFPYDKERNFVRLVRGMGYDERIAQAMGEPNSKGINS